MIPIVRMDFTGQGTDFVEVHPRNIKDLKIKAVYATFSQSGSMEAIHPNIRLAPIDLEFNDGSEPTEDNPQGGDAWNINQYYIKGLAGGFGVGFGIPMQMIGTGDTEGLVIFDGIYNLGASTKRMEPDKVVAPFRENISMDWFMNLTGSLDFILLRQYSCTQGTSADGRTITANQPLMTAPGGGGVYTYQTTAYQIKYDKQLIAILNSLIHLVEMMSDLVTAGVTLAKQISETVSDAADLPFDVAQAIEDALLLTYDLLKLVINLGAVVGSIEVLAAQIGLISKYKYCMIVTDIIYAILTYVNQQGGTPNITFSSSILGVGKNGIFYDPGNPTFAPYANYPLGKTTDLTRALTWMPKKSIVQNQSAKPSITNFVNGWEHPLGDETKPNTLGPPYGCPDGNVKEWLLNMCKPFNGVLKLLPLNGSNDVQLEEMHFWNTPVDYTMPNVGRVGYTATLPKPVGDNWNEGSFNYMVACMLDPKDEMTDDMYNGTTCTAIISAKTSSNTLYSTSPPGRIVQLPFALAKTKQWLSFGDDVINEMVEFVGPIYNILYGLINQPATTLYDILFDESAISNHLGINKITVTYPYLELSSDTTGVPKMFMGIRQGSPIAFNPSGGASENPFWEQASGNGPQADPGGVCWQPDWDDSPYPDPNQTAANNKGTAVNESYVSADCFTRLFHSKNFLTPAMGRFDPANPYTTGYSGGNQWQTYEGKDLNMAALSFLNIKLTGNVIKWVDGETPCVLEEFNYDMDKESVIDNKYRINQPYTSNLKIQILIDGTAV